jgi:pyruvate formate lyase activating enzyme
MCGTDYALSALMGRVLKDVPFYEQSGGGVTLSGGEPLCQPDFVLRFLQALKENRIHTALDTTGYADFETIERVLPLTDLFLYDLKHMDSDRHRKATGVPNGLILENAAKIAGLGGKMQIRVPIIPDFNDSEEHIRQIGSFCGSLGQAVVLVQLLPYHNLGVMKHLRIGDRNVVLEADPPPDSAVSRIKRLLEGYGLAVTVH